MAATEPGFQLSHYPDNAAAKVRRLQTGVVGPWLAASRFRCSVRVKVANTLSAPHSTVLQVKPGHAALSDIWVQDDTEKAAKSVTFWVPQPSLQLHVGNASCSFCSAGSSCSSQGSCVCAPQRSGTVGGTDGGKQVMGGRRCGVAWCTVVPQAVVMVVRDSCHVQCLCALVVPGVQGTT